MCRKTFYAIFDEGDMKVRAVVDNFNELNQLITGIYNEHYNYDKVDRKTARNLRRELSGRAVKWW